MNERLSPWLTDLEKRHSAELTFREIRRGLQALSTTYTQRRDNLGERVFGGAGKRAAFALFYGPLHALLTDRVIRELGAANPPLSRIVDLGCGTGAAGAAWAIQCPRAPSITGVEKNQWAVGEARWTLQTLGLAGRIQRGDLIKTELPGQAGGVIAAFVVNELPAPTRERLRDRLFAAALRGARILVLEPIAKQPLNWWDDWAAASVAAGGRADEWDFDLDLPKPLDDLDRAAGLRHHRLKGRSLYLPGAVAGTSHQP